MTSTSINIGLTSGTRNSSRVLKPPGGGYSNIFGGPDEAKPEPENFTHRARNNQQNSPGMSAVMGTIDANDVLRKTSAENINNSPDKIPETRSESPQQQSPTNGPGGRPRVPPGGFSNGLW